MILQTINYKDYCLKEKIKKISGLIKGELGENMMTAFTALRTKKCGYLIDDGDEDKKLEVTKKCTINRELKFEEYKNCLN